MRTQLGLHHAGGRTRRHALPRRRRLLAQHHDRAHGLPPVLILATEYSGLQHIRVGLKHSLYLTRRDVLATGDDRLRSAAADTEKARRVEAAEIACMKPAVGRERSWG